MPSISLDETYEPRRWACGECQCILGVVMRDTNKVRRLWVFRVHRCAESMPTAFTLRNAPRGLFSIHGLDLVSHPGGVECQHCGALNDWRLGDELFKKLMSHYQEVKSEPV
jgi:hypothetical protein